MALCPSFQGPNVYTEAPNGGWGWVVAVAFFLVEVFTYGTIKSFGIFLQDLMKEFGETNNRVSWTVSICVFVMTFNGPLSSVMTNRFGFQRVVMVGGVLIVSGTIATSFTTSINQMYFTYGLVAGFGYCLTFLPTVTILSKYFTSRRPLVTAVASTGESLSMFALAPAFSTLRNHIGWRHTMIVIGALQSIIIVCGGLLRPIVLKPKASHKTETDRLSSEELEVLSTQVNVEDISPEDSVLNNAPNTSSSPNREKTRSSVSDGDSVVQSVKTTDDSSPDKALLHKHASSETERKLAESNEITEEPKTEEDKKNKATEKGNKDEGDTSGDESLSANNSKLLDFSILKERSFVLYSLFGLFATFGFFAPQLYIIELSVSRGMERGLATYMLSTMAVAEIFGRLSIGWILTLRQFRTEKLLVLLACVITITVDLVGFTLVVEYCGLSVCCAVYGFFMGSIACTHIPMLAEDDVVGIDRMSSAAGVYVFIQSFAGLLGPPLGGWLVDLTQNYGSAFYSCAAGMALSALFLGLVKPAKRGLLCRRRNSRQMEDIHKRIEDSGEQGGGEHKLVKPERPRDCAEAEVFLDHNHTGATEDLKEVIRFA